MSATRQGEGSKRRKDDTYLTPDWCVRRLLEAYSPPGGFWLDPCAARGELIRAVKTARPDVRMGGCELREECREALESATGEDGCVIGDFFEYVERLHIAGRFDVVLTNPPFSLAEHFLRECMRIAKITIFLLRLGYFRGDGRHKLLEELKPGIFMLPNRPSFTGYGTDATEYAWFVMGDPAVAGRWFSLAETSEEEVAAWNRKARALHPKPVAATVVETKEAA